MQQKDGGKQILKGKGQLTKQASLDDDHELPLYLLPDFSVYTDTLKGVQDSTMVDSSPHIRPSLDICQKWSQ